MSKKVVLAVSYIVLIAALLITLFPVVYTLLSSFKSNMEIMTDPARIIPREFSLENYIKAWTSEEFNVPRMLVNSLYYTIINMTIILLISSMAGYVFSRGDFPGKKIVFGCFISLMFIHGTSISIYPQFEVLNALHIGKGLNGLLFMNLFAIPITNIYLVRGFVDTLPRELDEAAAMDGCGFFGTFIRIILPMLKPVLATIGILAFNGSWNAYLMPAIFTTTKPEQQTLMVGLMALKSSSGAATNWALMMAGSIIALFPVLIAYGFGNKYFVDGIAAGAVKG